LLGLPAGFYGASGGQNSGVCGAKRALLTNNPMSRKSGTKLMRPEMIRTIFAVLCALWLSASVAAAQTCGAYPDTLTNGQTADATQVMANFNFILNCLNSFNPPPPPLQGYIGGLGLSNDVGSPTTVLDIAAGVATDSTAAASIKIGPFTKSTGGAWTAGAGNSGMGQGLTIAATFWYDVCLASNGGTPDIWFDTSNRSTTYSQCANRPSGTSDTKFRRLGSFKTDSSAHILAFTQDGDYFRWTVNVLDLSGQTWTSAATDTPLTVPTGVTVQAFGVADGSALSSGNQYWVFRQTSG
jgi:hypothetical protein